MPCQEEESAAKRPEASWGGPGLPRTLVQRSQGAFADDDGIAFRVIVRRRLGHSVDAHWPHRPIRQVRHGLIGLSMDWLEVVEEDDDRFASVFERNEDRSAVPSPFLWLVR